MTFTAIQNAALKRFGQQGFSGTALADIASDVGIKPPSIYAHFKSKEELFLSLVEPTIEEELADVHGALASKVKGDLETLAAFLRAIEQRYEATPIFRFLLHGVYLPPQTLAREVDGSIQTYMKSLDKIMADYFQTILPGRLPPQVMAEAFMGIVDSLQAEILYGGKKRFRKRYKALWALFQLAWQ